MAEMQRSNTITHLVMKEKEVMGVEQEPMPPLGPEQSLIRTLYDGVSTGTELASFLGTNPKMNSGWDDKRRMFRDDIPPPSAELYPHREGYMPSGIVVASRNPKLPEGMLVAGQYTHRSHYVASEGDHLIPLPDGFDSEVAVLAGKFGPICLNGVVTAIDQRTGKSNIQRLQGSLLGERVAVMGAGMVGLLTGMFAKWAGADEVVIIDRAEQQLRLQAAEKLGMTSMATHPDWPIELKDHFASSNPDDTGADTIFQCTGSELLLGQAFKAVRQEGSIIDMGFYQGGAPNVRFGDEFHQNQIVHRCAQIGRIARRQAERWTRRSLAEEGIDFLTHNGADIKEHTFTHVVPFSQAQGLFTALANRNPDILQVVVQPDEVYALRHK
jgi:threonine dehydrogenase-like Zn-dependent dehydrogenase